MIKRILAPAVALLALSLASGSAGAEEISFIAFLNGANEVPAVPTGATGVAHLVVNPDEFALRFELHLFDIDSLQAAHIHFGAAGVSGPVVVSLSAGTFSAPLTGEIRFDEAGFLSDLSQGLWYVNVHTSDFPDGEVRGQLEPGELRGRQVTLIAPLNPLNEVPPITDLDAGGLAEVTLDLKVHGNRVVAGFTTFDVDYRFPGSVTTILMHVHKAPAGVSGGVVIDSRLQATADADGRGNIASRVPMLRADRLVIFEEILADPSQFYVNLHTTEHPGGALRGQLQRRRSL